MIVILFFCYALALAAAYRVAARLTPGQPLHTLGLTIFLWLINLILPVTYAGMMNLLRPEAMFAAGALLWGGELLLAGRLPVLPVPESPPETRRWVLLRRVGFVLCTLLYLQSSLVIIPAMRQYGVILDIDAAWHYLPSMIGMVQAGTLHYFQTFLPYFPLNFEMLLSWEMAFTRGVLLTIVFHQALMAMALIYAALIVRTMLRQHPAHVRDFAALITLFLLVGSAPLLSLFHSIGKNDLMLASCTLAAVYYALRSWDAKKHSSLLVLAGFACGLMVTTKLTSALWVGALALLHVGIMASRRQLTPRTLLQDAFRVGVPALFVALPWGTRLLFYPATTTSHAQLNALGLDNTLLRNWSVPAFIEATMARLPELGLMALGLGLLAAAQRASASFRTWLGTSGAVLLLSGLFVQAFGREPESSLSLFIAMVAVSAVLLTLCFNVVHLLVIISMGTFAFLPYSAWVYQAPYLIDLTYHHIMYRYTPGSYPLFIAAVVGGVWALLSGAQPARAPSPETETGKTPGQQFVIGVLVVFMIGAVVQYSGSDMRSLLTRYANFNDHHAQATPFYDWLYAHVQNARIYAINTPPLLLQGRDFSNQVFYATEGHSGYYGDQAYRWDEVRDMIERLRLDYVVVSFNYPELMQAALAPTPEVLAEVARMRSELRPIFDDVHVTVFATQYAELLPDLP